MSQAETLKLLEEDLKQQIEGFDASRKFYRRGFYYYTVLSAAFSALTSILIGAGQIYQSRFLSLVALSTSAGMTVLTAWNGFFRHRELWVQKTDTLMHLYKLDSNIRYAKASKGSTLSDQDIEAFYNRFEDVLIGEHELWKGVRSTQASTGHKAT